MCVCGGGGPAGLHTPECRHESRRRAPGRAAPSARLQSEGHRQAQRPACVADTIHHIPRSGRSGIQRAYSRAGQPTQQGNCQLTQSGGSTATGGRLPCKLPLSSGTAVRPLPDRLMPRSPSSVSLPAGRPATSSAEGRHRSQHRMQHVSTPPCQQWGRGGRAAAALEESRPISHRMGVGLKHAANG